MEIEKKPRYNYKKKVLKKAVLPPCNVTEKMREETETACEKLEMSLSDYIRYAIETMNMSVLDGKVE